MLSFTRSHLRFPSSKPELFPRIIFEFIRYLFMVSWASRPKMNHHLTLWTAHFEFSSTFLAQNEISTIFNRSTYLPRLIWILQTFLTPFLITLSRFIWFPFARLSSSFWQELTPFLQPKLLIWTSLSFASFPHPVFFFAPSIPYSFTLALFSSFLLLPSLLFLLWPFQLFLCAPFPW